MNEPQSPGMKLLIEVLEIPELANSVGPDTDLILAGINSGDLIRLGLIIEERTHRPLSDDDLTDLQTVSGIDRVLSARAQV